MMPQCNGILKYNIVNIFIFFIASRAALVHTQPPVQWVPGAKVAEVWSWPPIFICLQGIYLISVNAWHWPLVNLKVVWQFHIGEYLNCGLLKYDTMHASLFTIAFICYHSFLLKIIRVPRITDLKPASEPKQKYCWLVPLNWAHRLRSDMAMQKLTFLFRSC
jgi:hypothetical protein